MTAKRVLIRADASRQIGTGHLMRCRTLAQELVNLGCAVFFCSVVDESRLAVKLLEDKFPLVPLEEREAEDVSSLERLQGERFDLLVIDSYALGREFEVEASKFFPKIMAIDDLASRPHRVDLLLDQNLRPGGRELYCERVSAECQLLLGPEFALLRPEFAQARSRVHRTGSLQRIVITFGGSDAENATLAALQGALLAFEQRIPIEVILGPAYSHTASLQKIASQRSNVTLHQDVCNMWEFFARGELCLGAAGATTWERCCLGLPSVVVVLAENQRVLAEEVARAGAAVNLGGAQDVKPENYARAILELNAKSLSKMSQAGMQLVDGLGAKRVAREVVALLRQ